MRYNRALLYLIATSICAIVLIEPAFSDESLAYVLIERIQPDRLHMVVIGLTGSQSEIYVIKDRFYQKVQGVWQQSPAPMKSGTIPSKNGIIPSMTEIFESSASHVIELARRTVNGVEVRVFDAQISFDGPKGKTKGSMTISIDPVETLPTAISFKGECGGVTCSYDQGFDYGRGISIEPPVK
jgi:hypothetical protein